MANQVRSPARLAERTLAQASGTPSIRPVDDETGSHGSSGLADGQVGITVPIDHVAVIQTLNRQAKAGDVPSAKTLLSYLERFPAVDAHVDLAQQPAVMRDRLLRRLIAEEQAILDAEAGQLASRSQEGHEDSAIESQPSTEHSAEAEVHAGTHDTLQA